MSQTAPVGQSDQVDVRGLRFVAAVTSFVLALALVAPSPWTVVLTAAQAVVFAISAFGGVKQSPYALLFANFVRPRLTSEPEFEDSAPPRFAQSVGLVFTTGALVSFALGGELIGLILVAFALIAAFLNATVGFCLGCELYLILRRLSTR